MRVVYCPRFLPHFIEQEPAQGYVKRGKLDGLNVIIWSILTWQSLFKIQQIKEWIDRSLSPLVGNVTGNPHRVEHVFIVHKERLEVIYTLTAPGFTLDPAFLEAFRQGILCEEIALPVSEGEITQHSIAGKFVVIRAGRFEYVAIILNKNPDRFTREALHAFGIRFSSRWARELKTLYTDLNGDVSAFKQRSTMVGTVDDLAEDSFHLSLVPPHPQGMPPARFQGLENAVQNIVVDPARHEDYLLLRELQDAIGTTPPPVIAYLLITADPADRPTVLRDLRARPEITEAWSVEGDYDLVARVVVPSLFAIGKLVMRLRHHLLVQNTCTLIAQVDL